MTTPRTKRDMAKVKSAVRSMLTEDRVDDAVEMLLSVMEQLVSSNTELSLKLAKVLSERRRHSSEKIDSKQLSLLLEQLEPGAYEKDEEASEAETESLDAEIEAAREQAKKPRKRRARRRRPQAELPREIVRHELPEAERKCPGCAEPMAAIGEDVSEVVEFVPAQFVVQEHHRVKYACGRCKETVRTAPGPAKLIQKGLGGVGLLSDVVVSKYVHHTPLSRLCEKYRQGGFETSVSTLCGWVREVAAELTPVADAIWERARGSVHLQADASGIDVLDRDDPSGIRRGTMWCYVGDRTHAVFKYTRSGSGEEGPWDHLRDREGYLQADAATVFDRLFNGKVAQAEEVGCLAHARRKFYALRDVDVRVAYPLLLISQLYRVETLADLRELTPEARCALRRERSRRILDRYHRWLVLTLKSEPPASALHAACQYSLNHWKALTRFVDDGSLPLDNNLCERQIRSLALGRRNYLFAGSDAGAERAATCYTIFRTCALQGVDPHAYVKDVLERLANGWPASRLEELLPGNWKRPTEPSGQHDPHDPVPAS